MDAEPDVTNIGKCRKCGAIIRNPKHAHDDLLLCNTCAKESFKQSLHSRR